MEYAIYLIVVAFFVVGLFLYIRRKKRTRLMKIKHNIRSDPHGDHFDDDFYCIMRSDGSTSGGYIPRKD